MVLQTCIITLSNRLNWGKIILKLYFTTKPNEHLQALAYTSVFFYQIQWYIINNETKKVYFIYLPGTGSIFIEITKYIIRSVIHLILIHKRNFWNRMDVQGIITVVCERERNWAEIEWRALIENIQSAVNKDVSGTIHILRKHHPKPKLQNCTVMLHLIHP